MEVVRTILNSAVPLVAALAVLCHLCWVGIRRSWERVAGLDRLRQSVRPLKERQRAETEALADMACRLEEAKGRLTAAELRQLEDAISVRNAQAVDLQSQLNDLRRQGPREYTLMNERFGEKDRLWLLTVPRPDRPERWAVAAPDSGTALALLCARVTVPERPVVDDQLN